MGLVTFVLIVPYKYPATTTTTTTTTMGQTDKRTDGWGKTRNAAYRTDA